MFLIHSWLYRVSCGFYIEKGVVEGASLQFGVGDIVFLYSMCSLGACIFISVLGAMIILHKLKINGHQPGVSIVVGPTVLSLGWYFSWEQLS